VGTYGKKKIGSPLELLPLLLRLRWWEALMAGRAVVFGNKAATCVLADVLSSPAGRGGRGRLGGALRRISPLWPIEVAADGERRGMFLLYVLVVLFCCFSPCRPTVVVRGSGKVSAVPSELQSGGVSGG
jgi:hypothetical protein